MTSGFKDIGFRQSEFVEKNSVSYTFELFFTLFHYLPTCPGTVDTGKFGISWYGNISALLTSSANPPI